MILVAVLLCTLLRGVRMQESKIAAITLLMQAAMHCDDDTRLQRIVPYLLVICRLYMSWDRHCLSHCCTVTMSGVGLTGINSAVSRYIDQYLSHWHVYTVRGLKERSDELPNPFKLNTCFAWPAAAILAVYWTCCCTFSCVSHPLRSGGVKSPKHKLFPQRCGLFLISGASICLKLGA